ncbi:MAG: response regulator [Acidobacteria bacterium]|nr:MAG: response regulator [Acidobacteriota bacterium]
MGLEYLMAVVNQTGNILIVEDDPDTREMLSTLLSIEGFHAVGAEDGLEGLHLLRTVKHGAPDVPCLILLDLMMPRLGGHEFRRAQLGDPTVANVPVAVLSGAVDIEQRAQALGAVASVAKPIDVEMLMDVVRRYCA